MATRLYPVTRKPESLEILCGVPAGTYARLEAFEKEHPYTYDNEKGYERWKLLNADEDMGTLDNFKTFGWGRVDSRICDDNAGHTSEDIERILTHHNVYLTPEQIALTEGLCWS